MDHEQHGLLRQIIVDPHDDTNRLIYADWLEDHGDPRAEFIRIQCELADLERWESGYEALQTRSDNFLKHHEIAWKKELKLKCRMFFKRGFIEYLILSTKALSELDPTLFDRTPITFVRMTHFNKEKLRLLKASDVLRSVPGLKLKGNLGPDDIVSVLNLTSDRLNRLDFSGYESTLQPEIGAAVAKAVFAERLTEFNLRACGIPDAFFAALAHHGGLPNVERFEFGGGMSIGRPSHFEHLNLKRLRHLRVGGQLRVVDVEELCFLPLQQLESLNLQGTRLPAKGLKRLLQLGAFAKATRINLTTCNLSKSSLALMLVTPAPRCTHLNLANNANVNRQFVEYFASSDNYPALKAVNVSYTGVGHQADPAFVNSLPFALRNLK